MKESWPTLLTFGARDPRDEKVRERDGGEEERLRGSSLPGLFLGLLEKMLLPFSSVCMGQDWE